MEKKSYFFISVSKVDKPVAGLAKKNKEKTQITIIRNETRGVIGDPADVKRTVREHSEQHSTSLTL